MSEDILVFFCSNIFGAHGVARPTSPSQIHTPLSRGASVLVEAPLLLRRWFFI